MSEPDPGAPRTVPLPHDLVRVAARRGIEAVDILRLRSLCGAVRHDQESRSLEFLVPAGTAARWDLPNSTCHRAAESPGRRDWLLPPGGRAPELTDPAVLRDALAEAARTLAAAASASAPPVP